MEIVITCNETWFTYINLKRYQISITWILRPMLRFLLAGRIEIEECISIKEEEAVMQEKGNDLHFMKKVKDSSLSRWNLVWPRVRLLKVDQHLDNFDLINSAHASILYVFSINWQVYRSYFLFKIRKLLNFRMMNPRRGLVLQEHLHLTARLETT